MKTRIAPLLFALEETPRLLKEIILEINPELYKAKIEKNKWSIHEHATHIALTDTYGFQKRLQQFKTEEQSIIKPLSGANFDKDFFLNLDLEQSIEDFYKSRQKSIELAIAFNPNDWNKSAMHPEYKIYTPYIMLRHLLMHDHFHLYKIESMGFGVRT